MGFLTKWGSAWGQIPQTGGSVYWVSPSASYTVDGKAYSASDDYDGLSPERAKLTLASAISAATANAGDQICLLPGTHTQTAATALSKAGISIIGLPYFPEQAHASQVGAAMSHRPQAIITQSTAATVSLAVTAADVTIANVCLRPITQAASTTFSTAADRLTIRDCMIDMKTPVGHANTKGIIASGSTQAPDGLNILNCLFLEGNGGTSCGIALEVGAAVNFKVAGCTFQHDSTVASSATWTTASQAQDNCQGIYLNNLVNGGGGTITNGFKGVTHTGAGIVQFVGNLFTVAVTNPITSWAAADVGLLNNYIATVSGGTGGTLVTVST
jgi:hypothetical protein